MHTQDPPPLSRRGVRHANEARMKAAAAAVKLTTPLNKLAK